MSARKARPWVLAKEIRWMKEWLEVRGDIDAVYRGFAELLPKRRTNARMLAGALGDSANILALRGAIAVAEGDTAGWAGIHTAWKYNSWEVFAWAEEFDVLLAKANGAYDPDDPPLRALTWIEVNTAMLGIVAAVAFREDRFADLCARRFLHTLQDEHDPLVLRKWSWEATPFEPFTIKLYTLWRGINFELPSPPTGTLGVYERLLNAWENDSAFADAVKDVCDYHAANCHGDDDAFTTFPYSVFPAEIVALQRIREELGLSFPAIDHPLLNQPLAHVPRPVPKCDKDERFEEVVRRYQREVPGVRIPWEIP